MEKIRIVTRSNKNANFLILVTDKNIPCKIYIVLFLNPFVDFVISRWLLSLLNCKDRNGKRLGSIKMSSSSIAFPFTSNHAECKNCKLHNQKNLFHIILLILDS